MTYKTILVDADETPRSPERLSYAFRLAEQTGGTVVGLFAPRTRPLPAYAVAEAAAVVREAEAKQRATAAKAAEQAFRAAARDHGTVPVEWRVAEGDGLEAMLLSARYADVLVAGQPNLHADDTPRWFTGELVLAAGRPVVLVPYAGKFPSVAKRVLVAWNSGREAARAVTDALPLLKKADSVEVVAFEPKKSGDHGQLPGADIGLWLARHGVKVTVARQDGLDIDVGSQLLSRAADGDCDLIVMGAYGHSRLRELVLGGVTRTVLESMTVPVLMAH